MARKEPLAGRRIVLGVSGSIAAYKACEIASQLVQRGARVAVVMTRHAQAFVAPLTFQTITRTRVMTDLLDPDAILDAAHISITDEADLVLLAPATANVIGKAACGIADDALTSLLLAVKCPVLVAPAMNDRMWRNPAVQENVARLKRRGYEFLSPEEGYLACGTVAMGRLAEPARIIERVVARLTRAQRPR